LFVYLFAASPIKIARGNFEKVLERVALIRTRHCSLVYQKKIHFFLGRWTQRLIAIHNLNQRLTVEWFQLCKVGYSEQTKKRWFCVYTFPCKNNNPTETNEPKKLPTSVRCMLTQLASFVER
jgi:hypothetical protein